MLTHSTRPAREVCQYGMCRAKYARTLSATSARGLSVSMVCVEQGMLVHSAREQRERSGLSVWYVQSKICLHTQRRSVLVCAEQDMGTLSAREQRERSGVSVVCAEQDMLAHSAQGSSARGQVSHYSYVWSRICSHTQSERAQVVGQSICVEQDLLTHSGPEGASGLVTHGHMQSKRLSACSRGQWVIHGHMQSSGNCSQGVSVYYLVLT